MKENLKATTRRMIPILAQIVQRYLPGYKIDELAAGEKIKAREFSFSAQVYLLMLGQLAHVFSLNELVDLSTIFSGELRRIRGIDAVFAGFRASGYCIAPGDKCENNGVWRMA